MGGLASNWPGGTPVRILRRGVTGQDELGNDVYGVLETIPTSAILAPLQMKTAPRATRAASFAEEVEGQFVVATGYDAFFPPGTVIGVLDEVEIDGDIWRTSGRPSSYGSPFTGAAGPVQVELIRVTG
jgi:hypothetical protein